jgi:hypothetical protein
VARYGCVLVPAGWAEIHDASLGAQGRRRRQSPVGMNMSWGGRQMLACRGLWRRAAAWALGEGIMKQHVTYIPEKRFDMVLRATRVHQQKSRRPARGNRVGEGRCEGGRAGAAAWLRQSLFTVPESLWIAEVTGLRREAGDGKEDCGRFQEKKKKTERATRI